MSPVLDSRGVYSKTKTDSTYPVRKPTAPGQSTLLTTGCGSSSPTGSRLQARSNRLVAKGLCQYVSRFWVGVLTRPELFLGALAQEQGRP